jgi:hypothetical protein
LHFPTASHVSPLAVDLLEDLETHASLACGDRQSHCTAIPYPSIRDLVIASGSKVRMGAADAQ